MATVNKSFRIKNGLIVEGSTGTINGQNILTETGGDSYILNLVGGATLVKSVESTQLEVNGSGKLSVKSNVFDAYGAASTAESAAISAAASDATSKVAAEATLRIAGDAASVATAAADATSKANAAQSAAISAAATDATSKANAAQSAATTAAATDATTKANAAQTAAASDATTKANAAVTSANGYTDTAIATEVTNRNSAITSAINTEVSNRNTAIATAVDSLVDGAPALLNTLNELAAAINDDANYTTTITTALGTKANSADVTSAISTAVSTAASDATTKANAAQTAAASDATTKANAARTAAEATAAAALSSHEADTTNIHGIADTALLATKAYADGKASDAQTAATNAASSDATSKANAAQAAAEATAAAANTAQQNGTTAFTAVNVNDLVLQKAAQAVLSSIATSSSVMSWAKSSYPTAKLWVKFATATHSQISEILLTTDSSNNIAITDFAETGTNGSLGTISASYVSGNIGVEVSTVYANTTVTVVATLIK